MVSDYYTEEAEYFRQKIEFEKAFEDTYGVTFDRIRELADAEKDGRVVVLKELFTTPRGDHGFIYYNEHNLLMGQFYPTEAEAREKLAALAEPKGEATT